MDYSALLNYEKSSNLWYVNPNTFSPKYLHNNLNIALKDTKSNYQTQFFG